MSTTHTIHSNGAVTSDKPVVQVEKVVQPISLRELITEIDPTIRRSVIDMFLGSVNYALVYQSYLHLMTPGTKVYRPTLDTPNRDADLLRQKADEAGAYLPAPRKAPFELAQVAAVLRAIALDSEHSIAPGCEVKELWESAQLILDNMPVDVPPLEVAAAAEAFELSVTEMHAARTEELKRVRQEFIDNSPRILKYAKDLTIEQVHKDELDFDDAYSALTPVAQINLLTTAMNGIARFWNREFKRAEKGRVSADIGAAPLARNLHARAALTRTALIHRYRRELDSFFDNGNDLKELTAFAR